MIKVHLLKRSVLRKATKKANFVDMISVGGGPGLKFVSLSIVKLSVLHTVQVLNPPN